jgi:MerR family copper efflux transcriptional regulator
MYIGQLAKLTGCTPKAIRLYESIGLMPAPDRQGKYRVYTQHHADVVHTIRVAQSAGFKLAELHGLIEEKLRTGHFPLEMALQAISVKRGQVEAQMAGLRALDERLVALGRQLMAVFPTPGSSTGACEIRATPGLIQQIGESLP